MATNLTQTANCTLWYQWNDGVQYTSLQNLTVADSRSVTCARWQHTYSGELEINVDNPLPTTLEGFLNRVYISNVGPNITGTIPVQEQNPSNSSGTQLVQLDPNSNNVVQLDSNFYPIPVIDQGTAPTEVYLQSGSTLTTSSDFSQFSQDFIVTTLGQLLGVTLAIILVTIFLFKALMPVIRAFIKKLW